MNLRGQVLVEVGDSYLVERGGCFARGGKDGPPLKITGGGAQNPAAVGVGVGSRPVAPGRIRPIGVARATEEFKLRPLGGLASPREDAPAGDEPGMFQRRIVVALARGG